MDVEKQKTISDFVKESQKTLDTSEQILARLSTITDDEEKAEHITIVSGLFNILKKTSGTLDLYMFEKLTGTQNSLLQCYRNDPSLIKQQHLDVLDRGCGIIRRMLEQLEKKFNDRGFEQDIDALAKELEVCINEATFVSESPSGPVKEEVIFLDLKESGDTLPEEKAPEPTVDDEVVQTYVQDSDEQLTELEDALLALEKTSEGPDAKKHIETAFRNFHNMKGNAGFLNFAIIEKMAHTSENILDALKKDKLTLTDDIIQVLLKTIDTFRQGVAQLSRDRTFDSKPFENMLTELKDLLSPGEYASESADPALGDLLVDMGATTTKAISKALEKQNTPIGKILVNMGEVKPGVVNEALEEQTNIRHKEAVSTSSVPTPDTSASIQQNDIRVNLEKIDQLINLVGELVISEAMVVQHPELKNLDLENFKRATGLLRRNVRDIQDVAMSMRMVPVSSTFHKMIRVVHDVAKKSGKKAELQLIGEETEIDKTVAEQIADPLLHIIRNAVDHGLETPEERQAVGKSPTGTIKLTAKHTGSEVWIIIEDDGHGLDRDAILKRALESDLIGPDQDITDKEVWDLVLEPGFSTAKQVTGISGRGVGMDVAKRNIEQLNGRIDIESREGHGSTFVLQIPLTLAIIDGMLVRVGKELYVISLNTIIETFKTEASEFTNTPGGVEVIQIREELLPVVRLYKLHGITPDTTDPSKGIMMVVEENNSRICLFIDAVVDQLQVVVKALPESMGEVPNLSGCAIMGDGGISLILDVGSLVRDTSKVADSKPNESID